MSDAIVVERLSKYYGKKRVVNDVSVKIPAGCVYGFLGRNGAGKSTFIKMLLGMVQPDTGQATLLGEDSASLTPSIRTRIAYLAEGHPLYKWMTVREASRFTRSFYPVWHQAFFDGIIEHFSISPKKKIRRLSNGQRAQVSLALALAPDPELLILDDPTLGLDTVVRRDFLESMIQLIQRRGRTIFFSSHILGDVERISDRIGVLSDGVLRVDCPTDTFKSMVRRVIAEFPWSAPEVPVTKGIVSGQVAGNRWELVVVGTGDEQRELAVSLGAEATDVIEMNLEDAFIAYTRGIPRPLPVLVPEALPC